MPEKTQLTPEQQLVDAFIEGKKKPPNEMVGYLIEKMKACRTEFGVVQQNIQNLGQQLQAQEARALELNAEFNAYFKDVQHWLQPPSKKKKAAKKKAAPKKTVKKKVAKKKGKKK